MLSSAPVIITGSGGDCMNRFLMENLIAWKTSDRRKPLILLGARQVGKTWLLKEFGKTQFDNLVYINFEEDRSMCSQFEQDFDVDRLLLMIQATAEADIVFGKTLLVFDEIQECPRAITSLKYFCENAPELHVIAAGSLLGIGLHGSASFPVGKVNMLQLNPLSFREFLEAKGQHKLREVLDLGDVALYAGLKDKLELLLKEYYFVGGMPEVVAHYVEHQSLSQVKEIQSEICVGYKADMSKHLDQREYERALEIWQAIPTQLAREQKKFVFGHVAEGAQAKNYRSALTWLHEAGIIQIISNVTKPAVPLTGYKDSSFKVFMSDIGLLSCMNGLRPKTLVEKTALFSEYKGSLTEQYVMQQLISELKLVPHYWAAKNATAEIDFLVQHEGELYPIEVKAEENLRAKSLRVVSQKFEGTHPVRFSLAAYRDEGWMKNVPLWALGVTKLWLN